MNDYISLSGLSYFIIVYTVYPFPHKILHKNCPETRKLKHLHDWPQGRASLGRLGTKGMTEIQ